MSYQGPTIENPVLHYYNDLLELPCGSLIDVEGKIFEKTMTHEGHEATFIGLSDSSSTRVVSANDLRKDFIESNIRILRLGNFSG